MKKKLYLCEFTLRVSRYMVDGREDQIFTRLVRAENEEDAERILVERKEFKTDEYDVYRNIIYFDASEVIE